jgi:hypothetical protein
MTTQDLAIRSFRKRLAAVLVCRQALGLATVWLFVWGTVVLALRAALAISPLPLLWGLAGLLPCVAGGWLLARRQVPRAAAVRALLDREGRCGGLLMAGAEQPLSGWESALPEFELPRVHWRGRRAWGLLGTAAAFTALAFLLPPHLTDLTGNPSLDVGAEVEKLAQQIQVLKEEKLIDAARADDLKQKLDKLRDQASGKDPAKTLEALDHLENLAQKTAREAAEDALRKTEEMTRQEALAEALRKARKGKDIAPKVEAEAMAVLSRMARQAAAESKQLDEHLDPELTRAMEKGELSKEDLEKLAEALREAKGEFKGRLGKLHKLKLIDAKALKDCDKCAECKSDELLAYLKECRGSS